MPDVVTIDGSPGGGQILRTALSLSTLTEKPCRIVNIRGNRPNPGLRPQHQHAVSLLATIAKTDVGPLSEKTSVIEFRPQGFEHRDFCVQIGTAGSISLLFQSVLPIAYRSSTSFKISATGGTDVKWSPPIEYLKYVFLPMVANLGINSKITINKFGYYPKGNGNSTIEINKSFPVRHNFAKHNKLEDISIYSNSSRDLASNRVAQRQAEHAVRLLRNSEYPIGDVAPQYVRTLSTGSSLLIVARYGQIAAGFSRLGEQGKPAESVATDVVSEFERFHNSEGVIEKYLADQLIPYLAIAGGSMKVSDVTNHLKTNIDVVNEFGCRCHIDPQKGGGAVVTAPGLSLEAE